MDAAISLPDKIVDVLFAGAKWYSGTEIANLIEMPETDVLIELDKIVSNNPFVKRHGSGANAKYMVKLPPSIGNFLREFITTSAKAIHNFPDEDRQHLLRLNGYTIKEIIAIFDQANGVKSSPNTVRNYLQALKKLRLLRTNDTNNYYINILHIEALRDLAKDITFEEFWSAWNEKEVVELELHDLFFQSLEKLEVNWENLEKQVELGNWTEDKNGIKKIFFSSVGKIIVRILSNVNNPGSHLIQVFYKQRRIIYKNNRPIRVKMAMKRHEFPEFVSIIHNFFNEMRINGLCNFDFGEFDNFKVISIGMNVDVETTEMEKRVIQKFNNPSFSFTRAAVNVEHFNLILQHYTYFDKLLGKTKSRFEGHLKSPDASTIKGMMAILENGKHAVANQIASERVLVNQQELQEDFDDLKRTEKLRYDYEIENFVQDSQSRGSLQTLLIQATARQQALLDKKAQEIEVQLAQKTGELSDAIERISNEVQDLDQQFPQLSANIQYLSDILGQVSAIQTELLDAKKAGETRQSTIENALASFMASQNDTNTKLGKILESQSENTTKLTEILERPSRWVRFKNILTRKKSGN